MIYSINEGQQAEEYKARKAREAEGAKKAEEDRRRRRYEMNPNSRQYLPAGISKSYKKEDGVKIQYKGDGNRKSYDYISKDDGERSKMAMDSSRKELNRREFDKDMAYSTAVYHPTKDKDESYDEFRKAAQNLKNLGEHQPEANDAINRHMRRHPKQYKESFLLTEEDADEFLESIGVALYEDYITINEHLIPGVEAEAILEEHGIFLYEEGIIIEGEQAKEYMNGNRLEPQVRKISKELPAADIKRIPKKDENKNRMDTFVKSTHMRRRPDQYKESYGIFEDVAFIDEAAFREKKKIKKSEEWKHLKDAIKKAQNSNSPIDRMEALEECIKTIDILILEAKKIPDDNILEGIATGLKHFFTNPLYIIGAFCGITVVDLTNSRDDFIIKLIKWRNKCIKLYEKESKKVERH